MSDDASTSTSYLILTTKENGLLQERLDVALDPFILQFGIAMIDQGPISGDAGDVHLQLGDALRGKEQPQCADLVVRHAPCATDVRVRCQDSSLIVGSEGDPLLKGDIFMQVRHVDKVAPDHINDGASIRRQKTGISDLGLKG